MYLERTLIGKLEEDGRLDRNKSPKKDENGKKNGS